MKREIRLFGSILTLVMGFVLARVASGQTTGTIDARLRGNVDGSVTVRFRGVSGVAYRIESNDTVPPDPAQWSVAAQNILAGSGWTEWTDHTAATVPQRLYRVVPEAVSTYQPVAPVTVTAAPEEGGDLHYVASSNTVQAAQQLADESWSRIKEAADAGTLVGALGAGNYTNALQVLREYGIAEGTLTNMAARLGQPPPPATLAEPFLRAVVSLPLTGKAAAVKANLGTAAAQGCGRLYWVADNLGPDWTLRYDQQLAQLPGPPIGVLDVRLAEVDLIRFFKWYDRYAEKLHSVLVNSENLSNFDLKTRYTDANLIMSGLYKLIKARNPKAFVWVRVVWQEDGSDARWLQSLSFAPDGLWLWNLHSFVSPFETARQKYLPLVPPGAPMVVAEFYGFWPRLASLEDVKTLGGIIAANQAPLEQRLQALGFRGLAPDWQLVNAVNQAH